MEGIKKITRFVVLCALVSCFALADVATSEAAIQLVDPSSQQRVVAQNSGRQSASLERLAMSSQEEVLDKGSHQLERLAGASNEEVLDEGTLDSQFEVTKLYISNRITGRKSAYPMRSYADYKKLLDSLETGTVILITNPIQVSNINRWTSEVSEQFTKNNKGQVVSFTDVTSLSPMETEKFTAAGLDLSKVKAIEIRKEYKTNVVKYDDGKTEFDRGMETLNNIVSTWNLIDNIRNRY